MVLNKSVNMTALLVPLLRMCSRASWIARASAEKIEASEEMRPRNWNSSGGGLKIARPT